MADSLDRNLRGGHANSHAPLRVQDAPLGYSAWHSKVIGVAHGHQPQRPQAFPKPELQ
jgi:hypothetical protein